MASLLDTTLEARMKAWRHQLHQYPEPGFNKLRTSDFVADRLTGFGLEVTRNIGKTGIVGRLKKGASYWVQLTENLLKNETVTN